MITFIKCHTVIKKSFYTLKGYKINLFFFIKSRKSFQSIKMFDQRTGVCLYILQAMKKEPGEKGGNMKGGKGSGYELGCPFTDANFNILTQQPKNKMIVKLINYYIKRLSQLSQELPRNISTKMLYNFTKKSFAVLDGHLEIIFPEAPMACVPRHLFLTRT